MDKRSKYILITIVAMLVIIITGTFAWLTYQSRKTALVLTIGDLNNGYITLSPYQIDAEIDPELDYTGNEFVSITADNLNNPKPLKYSLFYEIEEIDNDLISSDFKYTVLKSDDGTTYTEYKTGNFSNASNNSTLLISNEILPSGETYYYKVYLWLDGSNNSNSGIEGAVFKGNLKADILGKNISYLADLSDTSSYFKQAEYKTKIYNVYFVFEDTVPNNAITIAGSNQNYYDLSADQDESIKGWLIETDTDKYDLYIGSKNKIYASTLSHLFFGMTAVETISLYNLDTSATTNMSYMFSSCNNLLSVDVSNFDTSNVTDMKLMFHACYKLLSIDVTNFDTSKVTNMQLMFGGCESITSLDVTNFNTSNVTNMGYMFNRCPNLTSLDLSNFNTSKVTSMNGMFQGCSSLTSLDLSNFDVTSINTSIGLMTTFAGCTALVTLDLSSWDTSNIIGSGNMFSGDTSLTTIYVSDLWDMSNNTSNSQMFKDCTSLPNFNSSVIDKTNAHYGSGGYLTYKAYTPPSS